MKVLIVLLSVFLLFYNLDSPMLWQDEAEVAMIARNITKFGLPVAYDGETLITQEEGQDSQVVGSNRLWSWNTWLPYYATAFSFKIFGENTFAARFPFAVAGIGTLAIYYFLAKKILGNNTKGVLLCLLVLLTNTLFYLYSRQARYYSFSMLFPLAAIYFYFSKRYWLYFLALVASFHSNFVLAFGLTLPLIILSLKNKATLLFLAQSFLWLYFFHPPSRNWIGPKEVLLRIVDYLNIINSFYFPLFLAATLVFFRKFSPPVKILILGCLTHILVISISLRFGQRYLVTLIPVFSLLVGLILTKIYQKSWSGLILIIPIFLLTNLPFVFSERLFHPAYWKTKPEIRFFFLDYVTSLPKSYPGPIEGISSFLSSEKINSGVPIYTDYEINSLRFYFPKLKFIDHPSPDALYWLPRDNWGYLRELTPCQKDLLEKVAQKIVLPNFDTQWENMPDITYHQFQIDKNTPHVIIYKVTDKINWPQCDLPKS